jgi:tRNA threonylcarbamoyladenosine biosynthesis protein TsaE
MTLDHTAILETRTVPWPDELACARHAQALAVHAAVWQALIELHGPLGAGKTTFVRHLLHALGVTGRIKSPTYAVMEHYEVEGRDISHFDFYRFNDPREWLDAGFRDIFATPGLKLVEWPAQAGAELPIPDLRLDIQPHENDEGRTVRMEALTPLGLELLK